MLSLELALVRGVRTAPAPGIKGDCQIFGGPAQSTPVNNGNRNGAMNRPHTCGAATRLSELLPSLFFSEHAD